MFKSPLDNPSVLKVNSTCVKLDPIDQSETNNVSIEIINFSPLFIPNDKIVDGSKFRAVADEK